MLFHEIFILFGIIYDFGSHEHIIYLFKMFFCFFKVFKHSCLPFG